MNKNELFSSFTYEQKTRFCLLQIWNEDNSNEFLSLILTDYLNYWTGSFTKNQIEHASNTHSFDLDSIKAQFLQAFSETIEPNYSLKITGLEKKTLELKKVLEEEVKVKIISLELKIADDPSPVSERIFNYSITKIDSLESKIDNLQNEVKRLANEKNEAIQTLKECVEQKENLEYDLYSKFVEVLNEKKAKIRELVKDDDDE
ncbi:unnamed protein product [Brachionus calyciflorus]|uniref:Uncharacterized protein n=1 Tax=Brachionus calyciflorus TaxID=104777 RepID=A0A813MIN8_9BILA|nr:unnamed protein product [Brachionus calyciflorus]